VRFNYYETFNNYLFFSFLYFLFPQKTIIIFIRADFVKTRNKNFEHLLLLIKAVKIRFTEVYQKNIKKFQKKEGFFK